MTRFFQARARTHRRSCPSDRLVGKTLQQQVDFLAHLDLLWTLAIIAALMIAAAAVLRPIDLGAPARGP